MADVVSKRMRSDRAKALPRGPAGHPLWGHLPAIIKDPMGFMTACARDYGDVVPLRLINVRSLFVNHPTYIEKVLAANRDAFSKPPVFRRNTMVTGKGMFATDGEGWRRQRQLALPGFNRSHLMTYAPAMVTVAGQTIPGWHDGDEVDIHREMTDLTIRVLAQALFGVTVESDVERILTAVTRIVESLAERFTTYYAIPEWLPTPANRRLGDATRELEAVVHRLIAARRASGDDRDDLLALYLRARDQQGGWVNDRLLRDELITFLIAGHETVALALTWCWHLLGQHPVAEAAFQAELETVLGGRLPAAQDLPRLPYTDAVLREALRLYPPFWAFARFAKRAVDLGDLHVPRARRVVVCPWVMHRDPRFFDDPDRFDPSRWLDGRTAHLPKYAYFPFGGGPRACIGAGFATLEGLLVLATVGQKIRFASVSDQPVELQPSLTLRPRHGLRVVVHRR